MKKHRRGPNAGGTLKIKHELKSSYFKILDNSKEEF